MFYLLNYANDLTTSTDFKFYVPWLYNPALSDVIINFKVEIWEENNIVYELKAYQEFHYAYASKNQAITTQTSIMTYYDLAAHTISKIDFRLLLTNDIIGDPKEKICWVLTESLPLWTGSYCLDFTCDALLEKHLLIYAPLTNILDQGTLSLYDIPTPDNPNYSQTWTAYIFKGDIIQNKLNFVIGTFTIPLPNNYATVTWRLPDENVPNPLISRHDRYLFRFRPSTAIPKGGKITIDFPALAADSTDTYTVDNACNPLHGIFGSGMKCASTSTTQISCTGFEEYDPWMPEIQIECYAKNPSAIGLTENFKISTYDSSGNTLFSNPTVGSFTLDYAPTEMNDFRMGWPERTMATACENRNYADLYVKIVSIRGVYGTGNTLRIYLPTGVGIAEDPTPTLFLECYWRNRFNKTPAEFCNYVTASSQNYIDVGVTDQQGLVINGEYTVHVYTRDSAGGLYYNSFILPTSPEWKSWYILATTGSQGDGAKVRNEVCPVPWTSLSLTPYSYTVTKWNILDLSFQPSRNIPIGGGVVIELKTTNELDQIFALDAGLNMDPLVFSKPLGCIVLSGFGSPVAGTIKCTCYKSLTISKYTPVYIYITGHTSVISSSSIHSIRIVKFQNPIQATSQILNEQLRVHFNVWSYCATSNVFGTDYARYNLDTLLNVFDYSGAKMMLDPAPTIYNNEILTNPITTIFTVYTSPLHTSIDLGVDVDTTTSFVIYEFDPAFTLPTTGSASITCNGAAVNCDIYSESLWVVWRENSVIDSTFTMDFLDSGVNAFKSPNYEAPSYILSAYIIDQGIWAEEHNFNPMPTVSRVSPTVTIAHRLSTLHRKTYDIWTITITPSKASIRTVRIDIYFPPEFMWLDSTCTYTGLSQTSNNIYPVSCISDCSNEICTNHITITNFDPVSAASTISVIIGAKNPETALTTSDFYVYYYSSETDTTQIIENWNGFPLTIDTIQYPYDYWVEWPTTSIYEREIADGDYGEIWFHFRSRVGLSSTSGWYKVILPDDFDIAPSATPKCTIYHTDMPFDNYPDRWSETRSHYEVSQCLYSNRVISVKFTGDILREFYGIKSIICMYLVLSTYPSPIDGSIGYRSALTAGCYSIQLYAMEGSDVIESAVPNICVLSEPSSTMQILSSTIDVDTNTILRLEFTASADVPNGYFYLDGTNPGSQGFIEIEFESYDSFAYDLDGQHGSDMQVFCNGISGIIPKDGEELSCKLTYGIVVLPPPALQHDPAVIEVSNFEKINEGTFVSLHLPIIRNPGTIGDTPQVTAGVYKQDYEGEVTWIEYKQKFDLTPVIASLSPIQNGICLFPSTACYVSNSNIRTRTNLILSFSTSISLTSGSMIVISFPDQYTDIPTSGLSATIKKNPLSNTATETYITQGITIVSYPQAKMVALTIPGTINSGETVDIALLNFTNPSYIDTIGYIEYYSINSAGQVQDSYITDNIFDIFSFTPLRFATFPAVSSNKFAQGTNVQLTLKSSLGIDLEKGSYIVVKVPNDYPDLSTLDPEPTCKTKIESNCLKVSNYMVVQDYETIKANTQIDIDLYSLLNPLNAVMVPQSSNGLTIEAFDASGRSIAYSEFPSYRIVEKNSVLKLQAEISSSFYESGVPTTYTFAISTMQTIPLGGDIVIIFPIEFPYLPTTERCFTSGALESINYCSIDQNTLIVNSNTKIKRYVNFVITIGSVVNPTFTTSTYTSAFEISTYYGGNMLDTLDIDDPKAKVLIKVPPESLVVVSSQFNPQNEGEVALYTFIVENPQDITQDDFIDFQVQFPIEYSYQLIPANKNIYCDSIPSHNSCYLQAPRTIIFSQLSTFTASQTMTFNIYSITNPIESTTNKFYLYVYDRTNSSLIAFDKTIDFQISSLPGILNMSSVESSSSITHTNAQYLFTFTLEDTGIKQNGGVYINWPGNYHYLFLSSYSCEFSNSTDPRLLNPSCTFLVQSGNRTSIVTLSQEITPIGQELFLEYLEVPTLQEHGNSGNFIIQLFDNDLSSISIRSYPNLTPYPNLDFVNKGYRIFINASEIEVYQGSYSLPVVLTLEKTSFDVLRIKPVPNDKRIGVVPEELVWQYAWDRKMSFKIYVPMSVEPGQYLLSWVKTENSTDVESREFKPLVNMFINVLAPGGSMPLICEDISYIPISGSSLPIKVWMPIPTYGSLSVSLDTSSPQQNSYVTITPNVLNFSVGDKEKYFIISIIYGAVSGYISLTLSGEAMDNYYLDRTLIPFQTLPIDESPPQVYSIRPTRIGRTFISLAVKASELVHIHYLITRKGTQKPTVQMLTYGDTMWCDTENYYGDLWTNIGQGFGEIVFSGLTDDTEYVAFIATVDRANRPSEEVFTYEFSTLPSYLPAKFRVYVTQVSSVEEIITGTAKALALPKDFLLHTGIDPALGITRRLETIEDTSHKLYYELTLFINRTLEVDKPITYVKNLDYSPEKLVAFIPYFDTTSKISKYATEYSTQYASFNKDYKIDSDSSGTVYVEVSLNTDGTIYGIILANDKIPPSSVQIKHGLDGHNRKVKSGRSCYEKVTQKEVKDLNFTGLPLNKKFIVYLTAENNLPGNPVLMKDEDVLEIDVTVAGELDTSYKFKFEYLNFGQILALMTIVFII